LDSKDYIKELKNLYRGLGYVSSFVHWRCWHTPYERVEQFVPKQGKIVDLGCGYGLFSNFLALTSNSREIIGIDISERKMNYSHRGLSNVSFQVGDAMNLNLTQCDGIVLNHMLHHLSSYQDQEKLLRHCYEKLKDGGTLINLEIDKKPFWKFMFTQLVDHVAYPGDKFYFRDSSEFEELFNSIGFKKIEVIPVHEGVPLSHVLYVAKK